jgi:putative DNA primase/helicase
MFDIGWKLKLRQYGPALEKLPTDEGLKQLLRLADGAKEGEVADMLRVYAPSLVEPYRDYLRSRANGAAAAQPRPQLKVVASPEPQPEPEPQPTPEPEPAPSPTWDPDPADTAPEFSEAKVARELGDRYAGRLRFVDRKGRWLEYTGDHWQDDDTRFVFDEARKVCVEMAALAQKPNEQKRLASKQTIAAVEAIARADRRMVATMADFDRDPRLLNCPGVAVDLRTGKTKANDPLDLCSNIAGVAPASRGTDCPQWKAFLAKIFANDQALIDYMQRALGYALTGLVTEHAVWFLYGHGGNGKGTLLRTMRRILGTYAAVAETAILIESKHVRHSTEIAMLTGKRFVMASETGDGQAWDEARLKMLTGGDPRTARFMRQDNFTYEPTDKLFIMGNSKPVLRRVDDALRRRFHLVPFTVQITDEERLADPNFEERLFAEEGPAILRWLIEGCREWQARGLQPPAAVLDATDEYLQAEDAIAQWLEECCTLDPNATETTAELFASFKKWATAANEPHRTMRKFAEALKDRKFEKRHFGQARGFQGIRINRRSYTDDPQYGG